MKVVSLILSLLIGPLAQAGIMSVNTLYYSDNLKTATETKSNRLQWDVGNLAFLGLLVFLETNR